MQWQDIATAPENTLLLGLRKHYTLGRRSPPVVVDVVFDEARNAIVDQNGQWSECTHWAALPQLAHIEGEVPPWLAEIGATISAYPLSHDHRPTNGSKQALLAKLDRDELLFDAPADLARQ